MNMQQKALFERTILDIGPNPEHGLGIEVDWDIVSRDWYSHIRLDEKGLKSQIRSI